MTQPSAQQMAEEMLAHGKITESDRDAVVRFAEFLHEAGPAPDLAQGAPKGKRWSLDFIHRYQDVLGTTDTEFDALVDGRAADGDAEAIEWKARREG